MIKCPICTAENEDNERFCRDCGQKLPGAGRVPPPAAPSIAAEREGIDADDATVTVPPPAASFEPVEPPLSAESAAPPTHDSTWENESQARGPLPCPSCGVINESSFRYCKACGQSLANPSQSESAPPPPPTFATRDSEERPAEKLEASAPEHAAESVPYTEPITTEPTGASSGLSSGATLEAPTAAETVPSATPAEAALPLTSDLQESSPPSQEAPAREPAVTTEPARASEPVRAAEPARAAEPNRAAEPARAAEPVAVPPPPPLSGQPGAAPFAGREAANVKIVCPQCGRPGAPGEHFCSECGARLAPVPASPVSAQAVCPGCGSPFQEGDKFCKNCGARLPAAGEAPGPRLILISNGEETVYPLTQPELTIGRHPSNDIPISADGYISSHHARIVVEGGAAYVEDNGSTNGTFIRVRERIPLSEGDEVKVGQSILRYQP